MSKKGWFGCQREIAHQCTISPLDHKGAIHWLGLMQRQRLCRPKSKCWKENFLLFAFTNNALCLRRARIIWTKQSRRSSSIWVNESDDKEADALVMTDEITGPKTFSTIDYSRA
ncbi:unnamed protein product [Clavelina lepadiformis]|uniref:Uncharacterized protein n=1 Tax=Clavelina lepadiformis TaxID=159417 RepID=A0ABP0G8L3_CLALP